MTEPIDPVTSALTGKLTFYLLLAAALTFPIAWFALRLYARAVRRSMRSQAHGNHAASVRPAPDAAAPGGDTVIAQPAIFYDLSRPAADASAAALLARLLSGPRRAALVYAIAGTTYSVLMATAQLLADGLEFLPLRFLFLAWTFWWPMVLTLGIVAGTTRRAKVAATVGYFVVLLTIGGVAMSRSPDLTWLQLIQSWTLYDMPATVLMLAFLSRRIRAVGPLILTFLLLALIGSDVALSIAGRQESYVRGILRLASSLGLGGTGAFVLTLMAGFLVFAMLGWAAVSWIGRRYQAKAISDESVTVDAIWLLFAIVHSTGLAFGHPLWTLAAPISFAAFESVARIGFSWLARTDATVDRAPSLLVLRSFSIGHDSERLFDVLGRYWRRVGSIQMIAGVDLITRTVEPHEFLDFVSGRLSRRFIGDEAALDRRIGERDLAADRDRRFRVNEFFCYDDTWKMVLSRLVHESDAVVMDLRGFSRDNTGCVFELQELARLMPLERVVFVTDRRTDEPLLAATLGGHKAGVFRLGSMAGGPLRALLRAVAGAATSRAEISSRHPPPITVA